MSAKPRLHWRFCGPALYRRPWTGRLWPCLLWSAAAVPLRHGCALARNRPCRRFRGTFPCYSASDSAWSLQAKV